MHALFAVLSPANQCFSYEYRDACAVGGGRERAAAPAALVQRLNYLSAKMFMMRPQ